MAKLFGNLPTTIPKSDPQVERVTLDEAQMGARKSHIPKLSKNRLSVTHVTQGR